MVKKGDTIEDVQKYVIFRINHLTLERQKAHLVNPKLAIEKAKKTLSAKIQELEKLKQVLNGDIKEHSKFEWRKVEHLKKMKAMANRPEECPRCGCSLRYEIETGLDVCVERCGYYG